MTEAELRRIEERATKEQAVSWAVPPLLAEVRRLRAVIALGEHRGQRCDWCLAFRNPDARSEVVMASQSTPGKRPVRGLARLVATFRATSNLSIQVAATKAGVSIPRWRDAESFGLATDATLAQLAKIGVDVGSLKQRDDVPRAADCPAFTPDGSIR